MVESKRFVKTPHTRKTVCNRLVFEGFVRVLLLIAVDDVLVELATFDSETKVICEMPGKSAVSLHARTQRQTQAGR